MKYVSDCVYEVDDRGTPRNAKVFFSDKMLETVEEGAIKQISNVAALPGCVGAFMMPDGHEGFGFPIGGVGAFRLDTGVITPMGVGYDINCGVRLLTTDYVLKNGTLNAAERTTVDQIIERLYKKIPSGFDRSDELCLSDAQMDEVFLEGPYAMVRRGYGTKGDIDVCEEHGRLENARVDAHTIIPKELSKKRQSVYDRGRSQLGTLGGGNHFLEMQIVKKVYDEEVARNFGISEGMITVMVHSGSRGAGHQICDDHHNIVKAAMHNYGIKTRDSQLSCVPIDSYEGKNYLDAMACGANFGWANRHVMGHFVRETVEEMLGCHVSTAYDVTHNIAKVEHHSVDGVPEYVQVIRKGATRAFCGGRPENPQKYMRYGHPVLIPGSMGTASYVLVGTYDGMHTTFGSVNHGAGRRMSRTAAKKAFDGVDITAELAARGIKVVAPTADSVKEEAPGAYKDIDEVIDVDVRAGLAKLVARMEPIAVMKG